MASNSLARIDSIDTIPAIREEDALIAAEAAVTGDWSKLAPDQRIQLYGAVCKSMGLNPLTQPFGWFSQGGKLVLYAFKGATDQLRKLHSVDVVSVDQEETGGLLVTTVKVRDATGREDLDIGAVPFGDLKGEARANALMKSITKAKRRATLSLVGLGMLDESEIASIPGARRAKLDMTSGEVLGEEPFEVDPTPIAPRQQRQQTTGTVSAVTEDDERKAAKSQLWDLANRTYGWTQDTLDAVAVDATKTHLRDMDAAALRDLTMLLVTESPEDREARVARATAIDAPQLDLG